MATVQHRFQIDDIIDVTVGFLYLNFEWCSRISAAYAPKEEVKYKIEISSCITLIWRGQQFRMYIMFRTL